MNANQVQNRLPQIPALVWNHSMQFHIRNIEEEVLTITVYESCLYTPDGMCFMSEWEYGEG